MAPDQALPQQLRQATPTLPRKENFRPRESSLRVGKRGRIYIPLICIAADVAKGIVARRLLGLPNSLGKPELPQR